MVALWVKVLATEPDNLSSVYGSTEWRERNDFDKLSSELPTCAGAHMGAYVYTYMTWYMSRGGLCSIICLTQGLLAFTPVYSRLAGLQALRHAPVSASHIPLGVLRLQMG